MAQARVSEARRRTPRGEVWADIGPDDIFGEHRFSGPRPVPAGDHDDNRPRPVPASNLDDNGLRPARSGTHDDNRPSRVATSPTVTPANHAGAGVPGRRTVHIQGRGTERYSGGYERRRPVRRAHERDGFRPDRAAMWAVLLGLVLVLVAATSSHAAVLHHAVLAAHHAAALTVR